MDITRNRITLQSVATHTGLGRSTVSLVLNGRGNELGIAKKTQDRVFKVARKLGYRPNSLASGLAGKKTQTIGLLLPSSPFYPQNLIPQELSLLLHRQGYHTYLVDSLQDQDVILESLTEMASRRVDGVVFSPYHNHFLTPAIREVLNQFSVSVLLAHEPIVRGSLRGHIVCESVVPGIHEVVDHFVKTGRRRPMLATNMTTSNQCKIKAFQAALSRHGLKAGEEVSVFGISRYLEGDPDYYTHFLNQFESKHLDEREFDALLCTSDEGAVAAINYLQEHNRRVPEDVAVVGLNDTPLAKGIRPPLASVQRNYRNTCELVVKRLIEKLNQPDLEPGYDDLRTKFIRRESAG
ncbi:MAG: LacI family DNA-binding transcriptional regulator [Phycisphaerae bacterium]|nr:LacI family DNA-binding transcriptional regulator [Phycisphaerae bacterium]